MDIMAEFVEFIIEYLYVIPDKINTYKERLSSKTDMQNDCEIERS